LINRPKLRKTAIALAIAFALPACSLNCPFNNNPLTPSLQYPARYEKPGGWVYLLPLDTWTRNPAVERELRTGLRAHGIASLTDKYHMQCVPRASETGCIDCFACRLTFHDWRVDMTSAVPFLYFPVSSCVDYGEIRLQAEIGPGSSVSAMTYWQMTPAVRENLSH
jgi:hypothetical protein